MAVSSLRNDRCPDARLKALMEVASKIDLIHGLNIQQYFGMLRSMLSAVELNIKSNDKEAAYVLASKFAILYLQHLPKHPDYTSINSVEKSEWNAKCSTLIKTAELLKEELRSRYEQEYAEYLEKEKALQAEKEAKALETAQEERRQQEKRSSVLGTLVPKSPVVKFPSNSSSSNHKLETNNRDMPDSAFLTPPTIDRGLKPILVKTNEYGLATVRISPILAHRFLSLAEANTRNNRETCANLCGRPVGPEYHITDLVLLKQSGTSDSCTTYKEEELFEHMDKRGLLSLGWIHTHPSQTAFLSSVDQHSQLSYQIMLPEAIAIVCAPKFNEIQTFSLTPDYGMQLVRQCKEVGFHPHTQAAPIYEPSKHVLDDPNLAFNVLDLR